MKRIAGVLALALVAGAILSGCVIAPLDGPYYEGRSYYGDRDYYRDHGYYGDQRYDRGPGAYYHRGR